MLRKLSRATPHAAILICNMYVVFYLIDRVNQAMNFIDNGLTKGLLLILCACALFNAWVLLKPALNRRQAAGRGSARGSGPSRADGGRRAGEVRRSPQASRVRATARDSGRDYARAKEANRW